MLSSLEIMGRTLAYGLITEPVDLRVEQNCQITALVLRAVGFNS
jgi:hypothetical protein